MKPSHIKLIHSEYEKNPQIPYFFNHVAVSTKTKEDYFEILEQMIADPIYNGETYGLGE